MSPARFVVKREVLKGAMMGEEPSWVTLYARLKPFIIGLCIGKCGLNYEDAQDVFQEVMVRFHRSLPTIENIGAWIYVVTKRTAFQRKERCSRRAPADLPDSEGLSREAVLTFWQAFNKLGAFCRKLLYLLFFEEYTHREVAAWMKIPAGSLHHRKNNCFNHFVILYRGERHEDAMLNAGRVFEPLGPVESPPGDLREMS